VTTRLLYFVSHPIQYQAPLLRRISMDPDINLQVIFEKNFSSSSYYDPGFGVDIEWDTPLMDGYQSYILENVDPKEFIRNADAVWVHGWESRKIRSILGLAKNIGKPILMRGENWYGAMPDGTGLRGWLKRRYLGYIFSQCTAFLAIGDANRNYYLEHGIAEDSIFSMPYAVDNSFFEARATKEAGRKFRQKLGIKGDKKIILFAGKLTTRKKPDVLLEGWEKADWSMESRPALVFVGDGELRQSLMLRAKLSRFKRDIFFTGFCNQAELPGAYKAADIFVLASEKEPWGLGINEAMACGTAVVASDQCGASYDLVSDTVGALVPAGNVVELSSALVNVLDQAKKMGLGASRCIMNWDFEADIAGLKQALDYVR
jgi:glycosyltransferase involved in cell wall biosynthesis